MRVDLDELVRMMVLDVIADDYENFETVLAEAAALGERCGLTIGPAAVARALTSLIDNGAAKAYRLSPWQPNEEIQGAPSANEFRECYFLVTDKGRQLQSAEYDGWPFDEQGAVRKDWSPPVF